MKPAEKRNKPLTVKQERFCLEVIQGKSFAKSYVEAGYSDQPSSSVGIRLKASRLRRTPAIAARIEELQEALVENCLMTKQQWLEKMDRMARADVRKIFNPQGDVKPMDEIGEEESELIEGVEVIEQFTKVGDHAEHTGYVKRLKLTSKRQILKDYGEARGWVDDSDQPKGPQRIIIRQWVQHTEEQHVHLIHNPGIIDINGVHDAGAAGAVLGPAGSGTTMDGGTSGGGGTDTNDARAANAGGGRSGEIVPALSVPATSRASTPAVISEAAQLHHDEHGRGDIEHELLLKARRVSVREITGDE